MFDEQPSEAWKLRFGTSSEGLPELDKFLNHRCVRKYSSEPIAEETIVGLVAAAQSAATSSNLQLYSLISVQDEARREAMTLLCGNQNQVRTASWFFGFFADIHRLKESAKRVGMDCEGLDYAEFFTMAVIDAALAAERMVCAAESLGIGVCYIGGLRNQPYEVQKMLELPDGVVGLFGLTFGYPQEPLDAAIKPRLSPSAVWFRETYTEADTDEYNDRMRAFYEREGMKGDVTWSMRSGRRVDGNHMTGREVLLEYFQKNGYLLR